jgi:light-regulated signal transduction histidine kinase (bacteriophytochrome)
VNAAPLRDAEGAIVGAVRSLRDITRRRQAEEALMRQAQELARYNAELEQFAYVAAHDLQEPLRTVASFTQLLGIRYKGKLDGDADKFIEQAVNGAKRMKRLIDDLLTYSRVTRRAGNLQTTEAGSAFQQSLESLRAAVEESGATVTCDALPAVTADPSQLTQVFQNLLGNAIKFHGDRPPEVHVWAEQQGTDWVFSVRDNGIGIEPQYAERIFEIFERLHGKHEYPGTGIGLALCKRIIEQHHGRIWVESQPGEGTTFRFALPTA